ncbi:hypothetical protein FRC11_010658 [Ceratobasidium sp. 423]|nr:hypothetical protein FRC11_010658 [Ceratobasidium sp. 423]
MPAADPADQQAARAFEAELRAARIRRSGRLLEAAQLEAQVLLDHARDSWAKERKREATREARLAELRTQPRDLDCLKSPDSSGGAWQGIGRRKKRCRTFNAVGRAFNARKQVRFSVPPVCRPDLASSSPVDLFMADPYVTTPPALREAVEQLVISVRKAPPYSRHHNWEAFSPNPDYVPSVPPARPHVPTPEYLYSPEPGAFYCMGVDVDPQLAWLVARGRHHWIRNPTYNMREAVFDISAAQRDSPGLLDSITQILFPGGIARLDLALDPFGLEVVVDLCVGWFDVMTRGA